MNLYSSHTYEIRYRYEIQNSKNSKNSNNNKNSTDYNIYSEWKTHRFSKIWKLNQFFKLSNLQSSHIYQCQIRYKLQNMKYFSPYSLPRITVKTEKSPPKEYNIALLSNIQLLVHGYIHETMISFNAPLVLCSDDIEDENKNEYHLTISDSIPMEIYQLIQAFYYQKFRLEWSDAHKGKHLVISELNTKVKFNGSFNGHSIRCLMGIKKGMCLEMRFVINLQGDEVFSGNFFGVVSSRCKKFNTTAYETTELIQGRNGLIDAYGLDAVENRIYKGCEKRYSYIVRWKKREFEMKKLQKLRMIVDYKSFDEEYAVLKFYLNGGKLMGSPKNVANGYTMKLPEVHENIVWYPVCSLVNVKSHCTIQMIKLHGSE